MRSTDQQASKGLRYIFIGQIVTLFSIIPLLGVIAAIAGLAISLIGYYTLSQTKTDYKPTFMLAILNLVLSIINAFTGSGILNQLITIALKIISLAIVYYLCTTTAALLRGINDQLAARGRTIWSLYLICTIIQIGCTLLMYIPIINILAGIAIFLNAIVQLIASILYIIFVYRSSVALDAA